MNKAGRRSETSSLAGLVTASEPRGRLALFHQHVALQVVGILLAVCAMQLLIPFAAPSGSDDSRYLQLARDIKCNGGQLYRTQANMTLHFPPGYPWLLSLVVGCDDLGWAPVVQRLYGGLTISIACAWATVRFGVGVGWLVFGLLLSNPALVSSASMLSSEAPHLPLYVGGFLAWFRFVRFPGAGPLILCGLLLGLSTYVRSYGLLLVGFLPLLILTGLRHCSWRQAMGYASILLTVWALVLGPWAVRNYQLWGHFVPITITGHSLYSAWFPPGPKQFGMMASDEVTKEAEKVQNAFERDAFFRQATLAKILADPVGALITTARKYVFYLMPFDWEFFGRYNAAGVLRPSLHFVYVFLMPFFLLYVWQHRREQQFWVGFMAPFLFGLVMTGMAYGIPRFRLCVEPFMTIFAAASLFQWMQDNTRQRAVVAGGYLLICIIGAYEFARQVQ